MIVTASDYFRKMNFTFYSENLSNFRFFEAITNKQTNKQTNKEVLWVERMRMRDKITYVQLEGGTILSDLLRKPLLLEALISIVWFLLKR